MTTKLYPLKFEPIIKDKVWGGNKLRTFFNKEAGDAAGESWEISAVKDNVSVVANGVCKGKKLTTLIQDFGEDLLGKRVSEKYGNDFPLLFKFIDAKQDLSVQLHPNDNLAKQRHNSFGKTEMWYIMQADDDARLILGFKKDSNQEEYETKLNEGKITQLLHEEPVAEGDSFFISTGTVHAIGAGVVLAEIQQTSDITYRIYDWDRPDKDGKMRELHTDLALDAIDYSVFNAKLNYSEIDNNAVNLKTSDYFKTDKLKITEPLERDLSKIDSFVVYMCVDGQGVISTGNTSESLIKGETILIPACFSKIKIQTSNMTLLEVSVP